MPNFFDQIIDTAGGILSDAFGWIAPNREELEYLKGGKGKAKKAQKKKAQKIQLTVPDVLEVQPSAPPPDPLEPIDLTGADPQKKKAQRYNSYKEAEAEAPSRWAARPSDR